MAPLHQPAGGGNRSAGRCGPIAQRPCPLVSSRRHRNATGQRLAAVVEHAAAARRVSCVQSGAGRTREAGCISGMAPPQTLAGCCVLPCRHGGMRIGDLCLPPSAGHHPPCGGRAAGPPPQRAAGVRACAAARDAPRTRLAPRRNMPNLAAPELRAVCPRRRARALVLPAAPRQARCLPRSPPPLPPLAATGRTPARSYPPTLGAPRLWSCPRARTGWPTSCAGTRCPTARAGTTPPTWTATDTAQTTTTYLLVSHATAVLSGFSSRTCFESWAQPCGVVCQRRRRRWLLRQALLRGRRARSCVQPWRPITAPGRNLNRPAWHLSRLSRHTSLVPLFPCPQ